jgi:hypothetical protein
MADSFRWQMISNQDERLFSQDLFDDPEQACAWLEDFVKRPSHYEIVDEDDYPILSERVLVDGELYLIGDDEEEYEWPSATESEMEPSSNESED